MNMYQQETVQPLTHEEEYEELMQAAAAAVIRMHRRDFHIAFDACTKYLGRDLLREERQRQFDSLSVEEKQRMENTQDFGIYSTSSFVSQPSVPLALRLAAHELLPNKGGVGALTSLDRKKLADPTTIAEISARFPEMSPQRIRKILAFQ
jgi:hypothetical protein